MDYSRLPTPETLRQLLRYEPETGKLFWFPRTADRFTETRFSKEVRAKQWNACFAGKEAFTAITNQGYRAGMLLGKSCKAHTIAWALHHGAYPSGEIDHLNGERADNRLVNLRDVTREMNRRNSKRGVNNTSGCPGVWWVKSKRRWVALLYINGGRKYIGAFKDKDAAIEARKKAETGWGFTPRHGT